ncbi:hypothetical protein GEMRC1_007321 [Eukaryota sp. GEM-RC1]
MQLFLNIPGVDCKKVEMLTPLYTVSQSFSRIDVTVELPSKKPGDIDVIISDVHVKVNSAPYVLLLDLPYEVSISESSFKSVFGEVTISLKKTTDQYWPYVTIPDKEMSKQARLSRRTESLNRYTSHLQSQDQKHSETQQQVDRQSLSHQYSLQKQERQHLDELMAHEQSVIANTVSSLPIKPSPTSTPTTHAALPPVRKTLSIKVNLTPAGSLCSREERPETFCSSDQHANTPDEALLVRARNLVQGKDLVSAFNVVTSVLAKYPFNISALVLRASICVGLGRRSQALADIDTVIGRSDGQLSKNDRGLIGEVLQQKSDLLMEINEFYSAWECFNQSLQYFDQQDVKFNEVRQNYWICSETVLKSLLEKGRILLISQEYHEASSFFCNCLSICENVPLSLANEYHPQCFLNLTLCLMKNHEIDLAFSKINEFFRDFDTLKVKFSQDFIDVLKQRQQLLRMLS